MCFSVVVVMVVEVVVVTAAATTTVEGRKYAANMIDIVAEGETKNDRNHENRGGGRERENDGREYNERNH